MRKEAGRFNREAGRPEGRLGENPVGRLTHVEGGADRYLACEAPVVLVGVGDDDAQQGGVVRLEAWYLRQFDDFVPLGVEWSSDVQDQA